MVKSATIESIPIQQLGSYLIKMGFELVTPESIYEKPKYKKNDTIIYVCAPCRYIKVNGERISGSQFPVTLLNKINNPSLS